MKIIYRTSSESDASLTQGFLSTREIESRMETDLQVRTQHSSFTEYLLLVEEEDEAKALEALQERNSFKPMNTKKLTRSNDKIIAGVLAGIAEYANIDPTVVRLGFVVMLVLTGLFPFGLIYVIAWVIMPEAPAHEPKNEKRDVSHETESAS